MTKHILKSYSLGFICIILISLFFSLTPNLLWINLNDGEVFQKQGIIELSYFNNSMSPILIDGSASGVGAHNWSWAEDQEWCTGNGTLENPYLIANLTIDGTALGYGTTGISISNSEKYFQVKNCTIINCTTGITLYTVSSGELLSNNITGIYSGINIYESSINNIIMNNSIAHNEQGIRIQSDSNHNYIIENDIFNSEESGIIMQSQCAYNNISYNDIYNNRDGILFWSECDNNTILRNMIFENTLYGIGVRGRSDFNKITQNDLINNGKNIYIDDDCVGNIITDNDYGDLDTDGDGLTDTEELNTYYTDINNIDSDDDGLNDFDEIEHGTNPNCIDTDKDNLNDAFELKYGTDPLDDDSDNDGYYDGIEVASGTDPLDSLDYPGATDDDEDDNGNDEPEEDGPSNIILGYDLILVFGSIVIISIILDKKFEME